MLFAENRQKSAVNADAHERSAVDFSVASADSVEPIFPELAGRFRASGPNGADTSGVSARAFGQRISEDDANGGSASGRGHDHDLSEQSSSVHGSSACQLSSEESFGREPLRSGHPLSDEDWNRSLWALESGLCQRFTGLVPVLRHIRSLQHDPDFVSKAQRIARESLGFELPVRLLENAWIHGLDNRPLYLAAIFELCDRLVNEYWEGREALEDEASRALSYFLDCDFHEIDISPCSDGRLLGLRRFILRLPDMAIRVKSYAGAIFDIEEDVQHWTRTELMRFREGYPTTADVPSRYLKVAAYHYSSRDPSKGGCAAHGSCERDAADAALRQLRAFRQAIQNTYCCGASVDTLLIGVDTDDDSIKIHVPDGDTRMSLYRAIDSGVIYRETIDMDADSALLHIQKRLGEVIATTGWGQGNGAPHEGMQRLITRLLLNNLSQLDYVARYHDGCYRDLDHHEQVIIVGDEMEEMQVRNLAYFAHLDTIEEGAVHVDVAVSKIFKRLNTERGLPVPVIVHYRYDRKVPGSRDRVEAHCRRVREAIESRYRDLVQKGLMGCHMVIRNRVSGSKLEWLQD